MHSFEEIEKIINQVQIDFHIWRNVELFARLKLIKNLALYFEDNIETLSNLITMEMGKPLQQSRQEIKKCIKLCKYYFDNSEKVLVDNPIKLTNQKGFVSHQPLGVILGIMPWNFPFWQVLRFTVPTIIAGNGIILKHAPNVQGCASKIEKCFQISGFPASLVRNIRLKKGKIKKVIKHPLVMAVSLTGSTIAGKSVAKIAGFALKKTVLELGGNDPYLIFSDADISKSAEASISGRILNAGQSCIAAKRIIVVDKVYNNFLKIFIDQLKKKRMGNPMKKVDIGPMVSKKARDVVHRQVLESIKKGAKLLLGGKIPNLSGAYYPVTVLTEVEPNMPAFDQEIFGPVFSIIKTKNEREAIDMANCSNFGLGAAIFTKDIAKASEIAKKKIESGCCFINDFVKSDPRMPFGGIKDSGYGRELASEGLLEFVNLKTIVVRG